MISLYSCNLQPTTFEIINIRDLEHPTQFLFLAGSWFHPGNAVSLISHNKGIASIYRAPTMCRALCRMVLNFSSVTSLWLDAIISILQIRSLECSGIKWLAQALTGGRHQESRFEYSLHRLLLIFPETIRQTTNGGDLQNKNRFSVSK